jgi:hypothetical protein
MQITLFGCVLLDIFMAPLKGIGALIVTLVGIFSLLGYLQYASDMSQDAARLSQGDTNAASDMSQKTADFVVGEVQWSLGIAVAIAVCSMLGLGFLVKILRRC